jgi:hypothetical protein
VHTVTICCHQLVVMTELVHDQTAVLIELTETILRAATRADWDTYAKHTADNVTCFEPEAKGHLVVGLGEGIEREFVSTCSTVWHSDS